MSDPVDRPDYWRKRISACKGELHRAMYEGPIDSFSRTEYLDRIVLENTVKPDASILDCGCGYGRLLYLLPDWWEGWYYGIDISPDFIAMARVFHPSRSFAVGDLRRIELAGDMYDLAVVSWVKGMVEEHLGAQVWRKMESEIRKYAKEILYLREDG